MQQMVCTLGRAVINALTLRRSAGGQFGNGKIGASPLNPALQDSFRKLKFPPSQPTLSHRVGPKEGLSDLAEVFDVFIVC